MLWKDSVTKQTRINTEGSDKSNERMLLLLPRLLNDTIFHDPMAIFKVGCSDIVLSVFQEDDEAEGHIVVVACLQVRNFRVPISTQTGFNFQFHSTRSIFLENKIGNPNELRMSLLLTLRRDGSTQMRGCIGKLRSY
jgi:hypothetical protein